MNNLKPIIIKSYEFVTTYLYFYITRRRNIIITI